MFFPEFLFQLSPRDQQVTWLDPIYPFAEPIPDAASSFDQTLITVPEGRLLLLTNAVIEAIPGAAQTVTAMILNLLPSGAGTRRRFAVDQTVASVLQARALNWSGEIAVPPGWSVVGTVSFDAGVAQNTVRIHGQGILIPIGNVQRV